MSIGNLKLRACSEKSADLRVNARDLRIPDPKRLARSPVCPLLLTLLWVLSGLSGTRASEWLNLGLAYDLFDQTLGPGHRMEAAGPFYYRDEGENTKIWAVPPVMSLTKQPATEMTEFNLAYPLFSYIRYGGQYRAQLFQLLSFAGGPSQTETNRHRFTLFPLYFQQWSSDPEQNYLAVGPFYGHLKNRLMRDEIEYVMFPLYSKTRKRDVVTENYLFPFFHLREGNGLTGWQFWPLVGHEQKEVTSRTNGFGDVELVPGHERLFVLWPFFHNQQAGLGTDNPEWQQAFLPLYSFTRSPKRDATTVLWPFFSRIENHERQYKEWQVPWPFIIFADGPGKNTRRIWPFYSHSQNTNQHNDFYLWPLYRYNGLRTASLERERRRLMFFLFSDTQEKNLENGKTRRRTDFWPLFTRRREWNGNERLQILAPLEPILPGNHNIEIEYSHAWSLWRSEKNPRTGASSKSLLWNLYRHPHPVVLHPGIPQRTRLDRLIVPGPMDPRLEQETDRLVRSWVRYRPETLRDYLVAGVEDPRINVQSVLTRHFLLRQLFPGRFERLMVEEIRFAAALNGLAGLLPALAAPEELAIVQHALRVGSDNAEGIQLPPAVIRSYGLLPTSADGVEVPNYLDAALADALIAPPESRLPQTALSTFEVLWRNVVAAEHVSASPPSFIEPACGSANDYRFFHSYGLARFLRYTGFDLCVTNIDNARSLFPTADFRTGNVFDLPASDRSFDLCCMHDLFEHLSLEGLLRAAQELARTTSRGMCLHFFNMDEIRDHQIRPVEEYHWNLLSMGRVRDLFTKLGFESQVLHIGTFLQMQTGCGETHNPNAYTFLLTRADALEP